MTAALVFRKLIAGEGLRTVAQPILRIDKGQRELAGFELLTRGPQGTNFERPQVLFEYARQSGFEADLDLACARVAFAQLAAIPVGYRIFFNIHGASLQRGTGWVDELLAIASGQAVELSRVVLEIVEDAPFRAGERYRRAIETLRSAGIAIALDDFGARNSGLVLLVETRPQVVKIDATIVVEADRDPWRAAALRAMVGLGREIGFDVVAEGVESSDLLATLEGLGVGFAQGFGIAMPMELPEIRGWIESRDA